MTAKNKIKTTLFGTLEIHVYPFRNYMRDNELQTIFDKIIAYAGENVFKAYVISYARFLAYVDEIMFNFTTETPEEYSGIRDWWDMVISGHSINECFDYYIEYVPNYIHNALTDTLDDAHTIPKPLEQKTITATEEDFLANPN